MKPNLKCDFCGAELRSFLDGWLYATKPTAREIIPGVIIEDADGLWLACQDCASLIEQGKAEELSERAASTYFQIYDPAPEYRAFIKNGISKTLADFWRGRSEKEITC